MAIRVGDIAPEFTQESTEGTILFHDWIGGKWAMLKAKLLKGWKELRPYLRMTPQPHNN